MTKHNEIGKRSFGYKGRVYIGILAILGILPAIARSDEHWALSLKPSDIQAAADAAVDGDIVVLPAGDYAGFNIRVNFKNGISLRGQGKNNTIIRMAGSFSSTALRWNSTNTTAHHQVQISDFSLYGPGSKTSNSGIAIQLMNADKMLDFIIHDLHIQGLCGSGIEIQKSKRGLVYQCSFKDILPIDLSSSGYGITVLGDELWDHPKPALGTAEMVFIEDCKFEQCKHGVATNYGSHHVVRYCDFSKPVGVRSLCDMHGYRGTYPGSNTWEIYHNAFHDPASTIDDRAIEPRGGSGVIWGNQIDNTIQRWVHIGIDTYVSYPDPYMVTDTYFWDNYHGGVVQTDVYSVAETKYTRKDHEYFMYPKPGYVPYPYPHPLRLATAPLAVAGFIQTRIH